MSVVLKIAVLDGIVIGADSRSTLHRPDNTHQVYDGVQKIFVLHKDYPAAMASFGLNRLGQTSLEHLMQEVRKRLEGRSPEYKDWKLDPSKVKLKDVAEKVSKFLFHDHYQPIKHLDGALSNLHLHFAGYSSDQQLPEHVEYKFIKDHMDGPHESTEGVQVNYLGGMYIARILSGFDPRLVPALVAAGADQKAVETTMQRAGQESLPTLVTPGMPLAELAALVRSLINTEITLRELGPEPDTVGGDIQLVVITPDGCRQMHFKPITFEIPTSTWQRGNVRDAR